MPKLFRYVAHFIYKRERGTEIGERKRSSKPAVFFLPFPSVMHRPTIPNYKIPFIILKAISHSEAGETKHLKITPAETRMSLGKRLKPSSLA